MQLRNLSIPTGAVFAPMAGLTDAACRHLLADHGARVQNADFGAAVTLAYTMEETRLPAFAAALTELSGGKYAPTQTGSLFAPV